MTASPDIVRRTYEYAIRAVALYRHMVRQADDAGQIMARQFVRAAMSIGANAEEAQAAESRADFVHKLSVALKEARECSYWLRLIIITNTLHPERLVQLAQETASIVAILTRIIATAKRRGLRPRDS